MILVPGTCVWNYLQKSKAKQIKIQRRFIIIYDWIIDVLAFVNYIEYLPWLLNINMYKFDNKYEMKLKLLCTIKLNNKPLLTSYKIICMIIYINENNIWTFTP